MKPRLLTAAAAIALLTGMPAAWAQNDAQPHEICPPDKECAPGGGAGGAAGREATAAGLGKESAARGHCARLSIEDERDRRDSRLETRSPSRGRGRRACPLSRTVSYFRCWPGALIDGAQPGQSHSPGYGGLQGAGRLYLPASLKGRGAMRSGGTELAPAETIGLPARCERHRKLKGG